MAHRTGNAPRSGAVEGGPGGSKRPETGSQKGSEGRLAPGQRLRLAFARYLRPAFTVTFFLRRKSRTTTAPSLTIVSVPSQRSSVIQVVPRTVALLWRPRVWKRPLA